MTPEQNEAYPPLRLAITLLGIVAEQALNRGDKKHLRDCRRRLIKKEARMMRAAS